MLRGYVNLYAVGLRRVSHKVGRPDNVVGRVGVA